MIVYIYRIIESYHVSNMKKLQLKLITIGCIKYKFKKSMSNIIIKYAFNQPKSFRYL